jgi:hypothetical protein
VQAGELKCQVENKPGVVDPVAPPQALGIGGEAEQPLQPNLLHPARRLTLAAAPAPTPRYVLVGLCVRSAATIVGLLSINIDWRRYYLPLVPIVCLWAAYGLVTAVRPFARVALRAA